MTKPPVSQTGPVAVKGAILQSGKFCLLGPLTFDVKQGECIGIIGPNGAGKSSLLGLLNATRRPFSGKVCLFNEDPWSLSESGRCLLRGRVATVLQRNDFNSTVPLTVHDVVAMGRLGHHGLLGRLSRPENARIDGILEEFGIGHLGRRPFGNLSGGEQQKAQIARALMQDPEMLLLDEPTSGLDPDWQDRLVTLIGELSAGRRLSILMTTHTLHHLPPCFGRVLLLQQGRMLFDGDTAAGLTPQHVTELYGCPLDIIVRNGRRYCIGVREDG